MVDNISEKKLERQYKIIIKWFKLPLFKYLKKH